MPKTSIYIALAFLPLMLIFLLFILLFIYIKKRYPNDIFIGTSLAFLVGPVNQFYIGNKDLLYFTFTLALIFISYSINKTFGYITSTMLPAIIVFVRMQFISPYWKGKHDKLLDIGTVFLANNEYYQAIRYLKNALKDNPSGHDALCALGFCYAKLHKSRKSSIYINKAAALGNEAAKEYLRNNSHFS